MKSNASLVYNLFLVIGDFLALIAAFVGAFVIRAASNTPVAHPISAHTYFYVFLGVLPFWILIFALLGLYNNSIHERRFSEFGRLLLGSFVGMLFVIFWNFASVKPIFPAKLVPIYGFGLGFLFLVMFRNIARLIRTELFGFNIGLTHVALVGSNTMTRELIHSLTDSRHSGYKVMAVVGDKRQVGDRPIKTYATFKQFLESAPSNLHGIIQTELYADEPRNAEILTYAQENHVSYRFVPGNTELFVGNIDVELFRNSIPVIAVRQTALFGWGRIVKRIFDIVVGGIFLLLASPLLLVIACAVKFTDPKGHVFMHGAQQNRLTRFNHVFKVYKFRSHYAQYDGKTDEEVFAMIGKPELIKEYRANGDRLKNDFRVTPVGKFIRKTSLDELPQLINVVRGDLSLVGPRALVAQEMAQYTKKHTILSVKSGLTGLAIVAGRRGISFEERRKLDLYYVQNWSFWLDIVILLKTVRALFDRTEAQ
ncbi:MAG TPA: exopolysaccharide biosynthesis polyprenyl glycosylphosphotransferase [Candidatus Saccharimonadales bacterium]|nr:exopolysaccharide biosynthesis polyprenyl glycosylphosphotransferase [Candidatus Saccharimonadales bacterium]